LSNRDALIGCSNLIVDDGRYLLVRESKADLVRAPGGALPHAGGDRELAARGLVRGSHIEQAIDAHANGAWLPLGLIEVVPASPFPQR
jgi:hypothetical protein